jgi:acetyl-CoA C-acetyltransferase
MNPEDVVIASAVRTPVGKFGGSLASFSAPALGALVVREAIQRAGISVGLVDECIMGHVLTAGLGQNTARQAALGAGLPDTVSAMVVNMVCGSGLKAVALAAQAIQTANAEIVVAGGMESMSNAPYLLPKARTGLRMGDSVVVDSMIRDGLWDVYNDYHMGITAENIAEQHGVTRAEQDAYALESHRRAAAAQSAGSFAREILPVPLPPKKGEAATLLTHDESVRPDSSLESLAKLKAAFRESGTVTAGNAPGVNDGAAALVLMRRSKAEQLGVQPLARVVAQATSGISPAVMGLAPIIGVQRVLDRAGWTRDEVDLFELNEAFSVQALALTRELGLELDRVNVNGGAVAIGHPIGASGARVLVTLLHALHARRQHRGVAALCLGGGNSVALAVESEAAQ